MWRYLKKSRVFETSDEISGSIKCEEFLTSRDSDSFPGRYLLHRVSK
jgi:hypothetical protein